MQVGISAKGEGFLRKELKADRLSLLYLCCLRAYAKFPAHDPKDSSKLKEIIEVILDGYPNTRRAVIKPVPTSTIGTVWKTATKQPHS